MDFGVWGLGFGVWGLGFWDWGLGCRVLGLLREHVAGGAAVGALPPLLALYKGYPLTRERTPLGPYHRPMHRVLWVLEFSYGRGTPVGFKVEGVGCRVWGLLFENVPGGAAVGARPPLQLFVRLWC